MEKLSLVNEIVEGKTQQDNLLNQEGKIEPGNNCLSQLN